jgi:sugar phosphate isomerase/epimerase
VYSVAQFIISAFADEIAQDLQTQMDVLEEYGVRYIEMRGVNGKGLVTYPLDEVREIKKRLDKRGFKLSSVGSPIGKINITDDFEPHMELFKHTLQIAEIMGAPYIRMFSFFIPKGEDPARYRDEVMERWNRFIQASGDYDVLLLHENEKDIYGDTAERCLDLMKTLNSPKVKSVFDPANFIQCDEETYPKAYRMLKDYVVYLHIKDALYEDRSVVPSGYGDGKVKEILTDLYKNGFEGFLSLEPHLQRFKDYGRLRIDSKVLDMEDGGLKQFAIAKIALDTIIREICE